MAISKRDMVVKQLERKILSGHYAPGEKLPSMRTLGSQFNVSTMVLHQAAEILADKGLLRRSPRSGLFINDPAENERQVFGLITSVAPFFMDNYYEGLFDSVSEAGGIVIPVNSGNEKDIRNMLAQKPSRVFVDTGSEFCIQPEHLKKMLKKVPVIFFNRFEWDGPLPESGVLLDYDSMTEYALRYLLNKGHRRILFLGHLREPLPFKVRSLTRAAERVGLKYNSYEFPYCWREDIVYRLDHVLELFKKDPPTAIISRSDTLQYEFIPKLSLITPMASQIESIGCFNTVWSRIRGSRFSTFDPCWKQAWEKAIHHPQGGIEWFIPKFIERLPGTINIEFDDSEQSDPIN